MASTVSQSVGLVNRSDVKDSSHGVLELQTRALPDGLYLASFTDWPRLYHSSSCPSTLGYLMLRIGFPLGSSLALLLGMGCTVTCPGPACQPIPDHSVGSRVRSCPIHQDGAGWPRGIPSGMPLGHCYRCAALHAHSPLPLVRHYMVGLGYGRVSPRVSHMGGAMGRAGRAGRT